MRMQMECTAEEAQQHTGKLSSVVIIRSMTELER